MGFQHLHDLIDVRLSFRILCFHRLDLIGGLFKDAEEALFLFFIKALELLHYICQQPAHFAQVLGLYIFQSRFRKVCHLLLCACSVLKHHRGIPQIDLLRERIYSPAFLFRQDAVIHCRILRLYGRSLLLFRHRERIQCQCGRCVKVFKLIAHLVSLHFHKNIFHKKTYFPPAFNPSSVRPSWASMV